MLSPQSPWSRARMRLLVRCLVVASGIIGAVFGAGCGARSGLGADDGAADGSGTTTGDGECAALGEACGSEADCCDAACTDGRCTKPPAACLGDTGPVLLASGLVDPYALGGTATSLILGQLAADRPLLRISKGEGVAEVVVEAVSFVDHLVVRQGEVFFSEPTSVSTVPVSGGPKALLASAAGAKGLDVTGKAVYFADNPIGRLIEIDRATLDSKVLGELYFDGTHRVAVAESVGLVYFSSLETSINWYNLKSGFFGSFDYDIPPTRAARIFGDRVYVTVPSTVEVLRLRVATADTELVADLSPLGVYPEALESDGTFLYLTLETGDGNGRIVRVPMAGGEVEVVADAQGPRPAGLVVDDECVYWTERETGSLFRAPKSPPP